CLALQALAVFSFPSPGGREAIQPVLFRPKVYHGMYCVLLVPLAVLPEMGTFSVSGTDIQTDSGFLHSVIFLLEAGSAMLLLAPRMLKVAPGYGFYLLILVSSAVLLPSVFQEGMSITALMVGILVALSAVICFPKMTPKSFTLGELFVVSHLLAHFLWRITRWLEARLLSQTVPSITDGYVYIFMSVMLVFVTLASLPLLLMNTGHHIVLILLLYLCGQSAWEAWRWHLTGVMLVFVTLASLPVLLMNAGHHIVTFLLPYAGFAVAALVTLQIITHSNPLLWFLHFLWNTTRIRLLIWWFTLAMLTAVCVTAFTHSSPSRGRSSSARASSSVRKAFHFVVVAVYTPGLAADPQFLLLASVVAFAVLIVLEVARLSKVQMLGPAIEESFQVFADSQDQGRVLLTHIYLLVGLSLPLWLAHSVHAGDLNNYAGVLSLGIGDTFACLFGARYGRTRWP
ncbi:hypothetical protein BaRGS_00028721, partial [Batillaria attramentaria]